jgi:16S rRNA (cytidine1402-2'-O)-methyltransferase
MPDPSTGTLFLVATPIGNLEDITLRALRVLRESALVAAEDTRRTAKLLTHYGITTPTISLHGHNESRRVPSILERLRSGEHVAVVSDAGTPAISDPGGLLVRAAIDGGFRVEAIPGPSAVLSALVVSGLPTREFVFLGFPPPRSAERRAWFSRVASFPQTLVFFEAPHRIIFSLSSALEVLGDRDVCVARELTKIHETVVIGPISHALLELGEPRGEYTVVVRGSSDQEEHAIGGIPTDSQVYSEFCHLTENGSGRRAAVSQIAKKYGARSRDVYLAVERARDP